MSAIRAELLHGLLREKKVHRQCIKKLVVQYCNLLVRVLKYNELKMICCKYALSTI